MKFVAISLPAIPASLEERQQLRPIGHRTDKWQQMIAENVTLAPMLDDDGWAAYTFPEPQRHTEGLEIGFSSALGMHMLHHTQRIKVGPIGSVLPTWSPVRLAVETAWLDQWSGSAPISTEDSNTLSADLLRS
jgi:alkanesulfonate monooxygenase SsuD/methylene tetrahydromethanopterin reductase-like flavin-dependent oxidoreductase (luciferase family)